jgi:hypothetical protein
LFPPPLAENTASISSDNNVCGPAESIRKMAAVVMEMVIWVFDLGRAAVVRPDSPVTLCSRSGVVRP